MPFKRFNPDAEVYGHEMGNLPHWRQWGCTYFVTSRLADSIPAPLRAEWQSKRDVWLAAHGATDPESLPDSERREYHRTFTAAFHAMLDSGHGECLLARGDCAEIVVARLIAGHERAYRLDAWVIMPNHIHAIVEPVEGMTLGEILKSWKGGSGREINVALGRQGTLWQREPFDHIVRSGEQMEHFRHYIAQNPAKAGLRNGYTIGIGAVRK
jgi:putative transposase